MQIECVLKRKHPKTGFVGSTVTFDRWPTPEGTPFANQPDTPPATYVFKPADPNDPEAPHIAEVAHAAHVHRLLECNGAFRIHAESAQLARPTPPPPKKVAAPVEDTNKADKPLSEELAKEIAAVRELPVRDLKAKINTFPQELLQCALEAEKASETPRKGFIDVVVAHLGTSGG
jgi:hypothetical protein